MLEKEVVKLHAPKNICSKIILISTDAAIFTTSKSSIKSKGLYNVNGDKETEMMAVKWKNDEFQHYFLSIRAIKFAFLPKMFCKIRTFQLKALISVFESN